MPGAPIGILKMLFFLIEAITLKVSAVICIWKIGSWLIVIKIIEKMSLLQTKLFTLSNIDLVCVKHSIIWMGLLISVFRRAKVENAVMLSKWVRVLIQHFKKSLAPVGIFCFTFSLSFFHLPLFPSNILNIILKAFSHFSLFLQVSNSGSFVHTTDLRKSGFAAWNIFQGFPFWACQYLTSICK